MIDLLRWILKVLDKNWLNHLFRGEPMIDQSCQLLAAMWKKKGKNPPARG